MKPILGNTIGFFPFILGILFRKHRVKTILLSIVYLVYLVGIDQKFTAFLFGLIAFMVSHVIVNKLYKNDNFLVFKKRYLIILASLLFGLVWFKYNNKNPYKHLGFSPVESIAYRAFGLQGHLFWGTAERYIIGDAENSWNISELPYGMHTLMFDFTPDHRKQYLEEAWQRGVSWTNGYPAILNRAFPLPIALVFHFVIFGFVPLFYALLFKALNGGNYLVSVIFFQITLWLFNIYSMSYFFRLGKILAILVILSLISFIFQKLKYDSN
ncbi:DUF6418 domain-containing protein [Croceitalea sp. MTPC5]|uniref:DUF6418 domain-containing protein n=1 Tax=Croceitalea sp. MTPC5 TaxID=3056565 RepID=UPI0030D25D74